MTLPWPNFAHGDRGKSAKPRGAARFLSDLHMCRVGEGLWLGSLDSNLEMSLKNIPLKVRTDFHESSRILARETVSRLSCRILLRSRRVYPQRPHSLGRG